MPKKLLLVVFIVVLLVLSVAVASMQDVVTLTGWFNVIYGDPAPDSGQEGVMLVLLQDANGNTIAHLNADYATILEYNREQVQVTGQFLDGGLLSEKQIEGSPELQITSIQSVGSDLFEEVVTGSQPWVNILCKFSDIATIPKSPSAINEFFSTNYPGLDHYWRAISYNMINLTGSVTSSQWYTLPQPRSFYVDINGNPNLDLIANHCTAAADAEIFYPPFVGINIMLNSDIGCCAWGGSSFITLDGVSKNYRMTWDPPWAQSHDVLSHEMGHGFGFPHSSGPADNPPAGLSIYVSSWDVMSNAGGTCVNTNANLGCIGQGVLASYITEDGWIPANRIAVVNMGVDTTITIDRLQQPINSTGTLWARIPIGGSSNQYYTVEVRDVSSGYDVNIPAHAVVIHKVNLNLTGNTGPALVVDAADGNDNVNDAGARWLPGETYTDSAENITIDVLSQTGSSFNVRIRNFSTIVVAPNDNPGSANVIASLPYTHSMNTSAATFVNEPSPACAPIGKTVWYRYTAPTALPNVQVDTEGSGFDTVVAVWTLSGATWTPVGCDDDAGTGTNSLLNVAMASGNTYYIQVGGYNGGSGSLTLNVTGIGGATSTPTNTPTNTPTPSNTPTNTPTATNPPPIQPPVPVAPTGTITDTSPTFSWTGAGSNAWYYLWIEGPSGHVIDQWYDAWNLCTGNTCSVTPPLDLPGGSYQWWVQQWTAVGGYSEWSAETVFTVNAAPQVAVPTAPIGTITETQPQFTWTGIASYSWYQIWLTGPNGTVHNQWYESTAICSGSTCSVTPPLTLVGGTYHWWVQLWSPLGGYAPWSNEAIFVVALPPVAPTQFAPTGTISNSQPLFGWSSVTAATWYYLWVSGSGGHVLDQWYQDTVCAGGVCTVTPPISFPNGSYQWWVQAWSPEGSYGVWSPAMNFTVSVAPIVTEEAPNLPEVTEVPSLPELPEVPVIPTEEAATVNQ